VLIAEFKISEMLLSFHLTIYSYSIDSNHV